MSKAYGYAPSCFCLSIHNNRFKYIIRSVILVILLFEYLHARPWSVLTINIIDVTIILCDLSSKIFVIIGISLSLQNKDILFREPDDDLMYCIQVDCLSL